MTQKVKNLCSKPLCCSRAETGCCVLCYYSVRQVWTEFIPVLHGYQLPLSVSLLLLSWCLLTFLDLPSTSQKLRYKGKAILPAPPHYQLFSGETNLEKKNINAWMCDQVKWVCWEGQRKAPIYGLKYHQPGEQWGANPELHKALKPLDFIK